MIFQLCMSAECSSWPRAEDESLVHVSHVRQDARHDHHSVNGWHPALPASVPLAPMAVCPIWWPASRSHRQTQVGTGREGWGVVGVQGRGMSS